MLVANRDDLTTLDLDFGGNGFEVCFVSCHIDELPSVFVRRFGDNVGLGGFRVEEGRIELALNSGDSGEDERVRVVDRSAKGRTLLQFGKAPFCDWQRQNRVRRGKQSRREDESDREGDGSLQ